MQWDFQYILNTLFEILYFKWVFSDLSSSCVRMWLPLLCPSERVCREGEVETPPPPQNLRQLTPCFVSPGRMTGCDYQVWLERRALIVCATTLKNCDSKPLPIFLALFRKSINAIVAFKIFILNLYVYIPRCIHLMVQRKQLLLWLTWTFT